MTHMQTLGYQRTLQATDLWKLDLSREAGHLGAKLDQAWDRRVKAAEDWNTRLAKGEIRPNLSQRVKWNLRALKHGRDYKAQLAALEQHWRLVRACQSRSVGRTHEGGEVSVWLARAGIKAFELSSSKTVEMRNFTRKLLPP